MKRRTRVAISVLVAIGGSYLVADAFDLTPGVLTARPLTHEAEEFPSVQPSRVPRPIVPELDPEAPMPDAAQVAAAATAFAEDSRITGQVSVEITDTLTGTTLASLNPSTAHEPASNMKILTAVAALKALGPDTTLPTTAVLSGTTLYLVGGGDILLAAGKGDPEAVVGHAGLADLAESAAKALSARGMTTVDVVVDSSLFSADLYHSSIEDFDRTYVMETRPLAINRSYNDSWQFTADPDLQAGAAFASALVSDGIAANVTGRGTAPSDAEKVGEVTSASMRQLVDVMLTESDNSLATVLGHLIGIARGHGGDFGGASQGTMDVLTELKLPLDGVVIAENSGLSGDDRLTTAVLMAILHDVSTCDGCDLASIPSGLPVIGLNGTLAGRLDDTDMGGRVRAKTGTLIDANSLSGYLLTTKGRLLTFSILVDGIETGTTGVARFAQDDFVTALAAL